jgi:hypothetical protein
MPHTPETCSECGSAPVRWMGETICPWCSAPADAFDTPCDAEIAHGLRTTHCDDCAQGKASA